MRGHGPADPPTHPQYFTVANEANDIEPAGGCNFMDGDTGLGRVQSRIPTGAAAADVPGTWAAVEQEDEQVPAARPQPWSSGISRTGLTARPNVKDFLGWADGTSLRRAEILSVTAYCRAEAGFGECKSGESET